VKEVTAIRASNAVDSFDSNVLFGTLRLVKTSVNL